MGEVQKETQWQKQLCLHCIFAKGPGRCPACIQKPSSMLPAVNADARISESVLLSILQASRSPSSVCRHRASPLQLLHSASSSSSTPHHSPTRRLAQVQRRGRERREVKYIQIPPSLIFSFSSFFPYLQVHKKAFSQETQRSKSLRTAKRRWKALKVFL